MITIGIGKGLGDMNDLERCQAAHEDDRSACDGPGDAVRVVDPRGGQSLACVHHGARMLASIKGSKVYPMRIEGAAVEAFNRARTLAPFDWLASS